MEVLVVMNVDTEMTKGKTSIVYRSANTIGLQLIFTRVALSLVNCDTISSLDKFVTGLGGP